MAKLKPSTAPISNAYIKIRLGKGKQSDVFYWGDGKLLNVDVTISEGSEPDTLNFSIFDKDGLLADKYFAVVKAKDGLEPVVTEQEDNTPNAGFTAAGEIPVIVRAFLDTIAVKESEGQYNIITGGSKFSSYADHPRQFQPDLNSDAAGRYQFLSTTWDEEAAKIGVRDFTPQSQDLVTIQYLKTLGAYDKVLAQDCSVVGDLSNIWIAFQNTEFDFCSYWAERVAAYGGTTQPTGEQNKLNTDSVSNSTAVTTARGVETSFAGQEVYIEIGTNGTVLFNAAFIHVGLGYSMYDSSILQFQCAAASVVMGILSANGAFQNTTTRQIARRLARKWGLELEMEEEGASYIYISQKNKTDMEFLAAELRRIGYVLQMRGRKLVVKRRVVNDRNIVITPNNVLRLEVSHTAGVGSKGAKEPKTNNRAGEKKHKIDPITGEIVNVIPDVELSPDEVTPTTSGSHVEENRPLTTGETDVEDRKRAVSEDRVKGVLLSVDMPTSEQLLTLTLDDAVKVKDVGRKFFDRFWVVDAINYKFSSSGYVTTLNLYTPTADKAPEEPTNASSAAPGSSAPTRNPGGFIRPTSGVFTSGFRTPQRPSHNGVDIADAEGSPVWASASGTVADVVTGCVVGDSSCGGGYGNLIIIDHGNGYTTYYAHLSQVYVQVGQSINQGQNIGAQGNTGSSRGTHLHFEIRQNGAPIDPASLISL